MHTQKLKIYFYIIYLNCLFFLVNQIESIWKIKVNKNQSMWFVRFERESKWIKIKNKKFRQSESKIKKDSDKPRESEPFFIFDSLWRIKICESKWIKSVRALTPTLRIGLREPKFFQGMELLFKNFQFKFDFQQFWFEISFLPLPA